MNTSPHDRRAAALEAIVIFIVLFSCFCIAAHNGMNFTLFIIGFLLTPIFVFIYTIHSACKIVFARVYSRIVRIILGIEIGIFAVASFLMPGDAGDLDGDYHSNLHFLGRWQRYDSPNYHSMERLAQVVGLGWALMCLVLCATLIIGIVLRSKSRVRVSTRKPTDGEVSLR